jgi:hypothetical protein
MTETFHKLLLSELHMVVIRSGNKAGINDRLLCEAVTVNENLRSLGYVLRPADLALLAISPDLRGFYDRLRELVPSVKAEPMYPGFPQQVMQMSEAQFRLHQIHRHGTCPFPKSTDTVEALQGMLRRKSAAQESAKDTAGGATFLHRPRAGAHTVT